ncbi:hypothetical protein EVAR_48042_1 [Eumeta japonica]|uniref:Uncharacterized protein n=1 Tax=Eumeta variegata TaxID=151549 RepID=A0A4C1XKB0_EUMVA|nr:hypothetical protein EVAR_48042_1 [Eumeta japonica]
MHGAATVYESSTKRRTTRPKCARKLRVRTKCVAYCAAPTIPSTVRLLGIVCDAMNTSGMDGLKHSSRHDCFDSTQCETSSVNSSGDVQHAAYSQWSRNKRHQIITQTVAGDNRQLCSLVSRDGLLSSLNILHTVIGDGSTGDFNAPGTLECYQGGNWVRDRHQNRESNLGRGTELKPKRDPNREATSGPISRMKPGATSSAGPRLGPTQDRSI